jgi:hypothetical protein
VPPKLEGQVEEHLAEAGFQRAEEQKPRAEVDFLVQAADFLKGECFRAEAVAELLLL